MGDQLNRISIGSGVYFSSVRDPKFKHNRLTVRFIMPLSKETASDYAVVPLILRTGCRTCPDFSSLNARLCELYGADLTADIGKSGGWQILEVSIKYLDNRFVLENEDLTSQCAKLLAEITLDPKLDKDGCFDHQDTALQRQFVLDSIEAEVNEKRAYAMLQCMRTMCEDEPVAVHRLGDISTANAITPKSAANAYRAMQDTAQVEIQFTGSGDPSGAKKLFSELFGALKRNPINYKRTRLRPDAASLREKTELMEVSQSKLVMGLRSGEVKSVEESNARRTFTALFGGTPFSKLFMNVRERLGLCYYCAARYDSATDLMMVDSGVEAANKQKAVDEIMAQLKAVQDSSFTDEELHNTKMLMKNSITTANDSLSSLEGWYFAQILLGQNFSPEEDAANIAQITREQLVAAANAVTLDTIYFLTGNQKEDA